MSAADVWVAKDDGSDIVRAAAIAGVGRDYNGNITVRLSGGDQTTVTLVHGDVPDRVHAPDDFHRQLLKVMTELSDTAEPAIVRPVCDAGHGWRWHTERL
ncbi:MAG: hypothetical protein ACRDPO_37440 [Streptosporangiaceae bacterium]